MTDCKRLFRSVRPENVRITAMRFTVVLLVLASAVVMPAQEQPRDSRSAQIDPKGQCEWIKGRDLEPVEKACEAAVQDWVTLPNFVCDMRMTRKEPWQRAERISAELRFIEGDEEMSNLTINGKPNESLPSTGIWTRGAFAPPGLTVLDGRSSPQFTFRGEETTPTGVKMLVFDYRVEKAKNQAWTWDIPPYKYHPGFHGTLRIDQRSGQLRRVTLVADDIDKYVPTLSASEATDYNPVRIGDLGEYLLPVHSEMKSCGRFSPGCAEIVRDFVNCRKFAAKARIVE